MLRSILFRRRIADAITHLYVGVLLTMAVAGSSYLLADIIRPLLPIPAVVLALAFGIILHPFAVSSKANAGLGFCSTTILRCSIALLGLQISFADIIAIGLNTTLIVIGSMFATIIVGFVLARAANCSAGFGALVGVGTAVCGASATLATSTIVPDYKNKSADVVIIIIVLNALSTAAMILYPLICSIMNLDERTTGIVLGATIHDVAQVAGAGYGVSILSGNTAVIVKLFRVFLLLPAVVAVSMYFNQSTTKQLNVKNLVPPFAVAFLMFCVTISIAQSIPSFSNVLPSVKSVASIASSWGLLIAISALGLRTSPEAILSVGGQHACVLLGTTGTILLIVILVLGF